MVGKAERKRIFIADDVGVILTMLKIRNVLRVVMVLLLE
jgi:hypothetical protein